MSSSDPVRRSCAVDPAAKLAHALEKVSLGEILEIVGQRLRGTKVAPELAELFQRLDGFVRVAARHDNDRIGWIGVLSETPPQPTLEHGREGKLRLDRIENLSAGIEPASTA